MSTAKRLVLSLRGRKESQSTVGTTASSTRLVSAGTNSCSTPGHELDEIAVVSGNTTDATAHHHLQHHQQQQQQQHHQQQHQQHHQQQQQQQHHNASLYGSMNQPMNGPRYVSGSYLNDAIENDLPPHPPPSRSQPFPYGTASASATATTTTTSPATSAATAASAAAAAASAAPSTAAAASATMATPPPPVTSVTGTTTIATTFNASSASPSTAVHNAATAAAADDYPFYRHRLSLNGHDGGNNATFGAGGGGNGGSGGRSGGVCHVIGVTPDRRPSHLQDDAAAAMPFRSAADDATAASTMRSPYFPLPPLSVSQQSLQRHPTHQHAHHTHPNHHHHRQHQTHCGGAGGGDWSAFGGGSGGDGSGCGGSGGYCGDISGAVSTVAATTASLHSCGEDFGASICDPLPDGDQRCTGSASRDIDRIDAAGRQHLMDIVTSKFGMPRQQLGQSISQQGFFSSRDTISQTCTTTGDGRGGGGGLGGLSSIGGAGLATGTGTAHTSQAHVSATASEMDLAAHHQHHQQARGHHKDRSRLKGGEQPLLGSWNRSAGGGGGPRGSNAQMLGATTTASSNHLGSGCNGTDRFARRSGCSSTSRLRAHTKWTFVFDPAGRLCYYWSMVVSLAFLYNFWVIIYRFSFQEINAQSIVVWFCLDYFADILYLVDILFHFRTGYLEDGVLQTDSGKLRTHYMNSTTFYIDCLCLLPLDFLYLSIGFNSILRSFRLVKIYRFWAFMDRTERHTNYPNVFRSTALIHYLLVIFHWNGCLYHLIYKNNGFGSKTWVYHDAESDDVVKQYLQSFYWCTLALTTIGDLPRPRSKPEYVFVIAQLLFGLMLFATVLGHVANIVTSVSAARKEFQAKLDGVKTYMRMRRVPNHLQVKVIKWFDYLWLTQKCSDEEKAVSCLPDKLKAEIAINVHLDTLKRVEIFQNTEAGFLCELVLRLRPVLFSPGDYICRKGEVGKEMYIVNRGRLQVVADNGKTVMASLKAGSYFGEISILNMGTAGNRRTASVRSVGYSDLFVLSKKDMWDVLKEYPAARVRLEAIAVKRLEKYKKAPLEKVAMGRCQSTPGLVETRGRTPIEEMWLCQSTHTALTYYNPQSMYSRAPSPRQQPPLRGDLCNERKKSMPTTETPCSLSPSSDEPPRSRAASRPQSQPSRGGGGVPSHICDSLTHLSGAAMPLLGSHETLEEEIKRLRQRLHTVETENSALNSKLSQQQWELDNRLTEIEMQLCAASSESSIDGAELEIEDLERNRESII